MWTAIWTALYRPSYEDDAFNILDQNNVDGRLLQHLSNQPAIRFNMDVEKNNTIPSLKKGQ